MPVLFPPFLANINTASHVTGKKLSSMLYQFLHQVPVCFYWSHIWCMDEVVALQLGFMAVIFVYILWRCPKYLSKILRWSPNVHSRCSHLFVLLLVSVLLLPFFLALSMSKSAAYATPRGVQYKILSLTSMNHALIRPRGIQVISMC